VRKVISRRHVVISMGRIAAGFSVVLAARGAVATDPICANPDAMDSGEKGLRASLNYTEAAPDQSRICSGCSFFHFSKGECGTCTIFNGGPANPKGHCDSWSAKT
jgi:hypothetical protein